MSQYNTRIQLKSDTEANWNKVPTFVPLNGEFIIYSADNNHHYCRLKVGDGATNISNLPFIDSGTINGEEVEIVKVIDFDHFPSPGSPDKLYIDLSTNSIYHYDPYNGYDKLSNFSFSTTKTIVSSISRWSAGTVTTASVNNNVLNIKNGLIPELSYYNTEVISDIQKE